MEFPIESIQSIVSERLPGFEPAGAPESLEGGNLNHVWRLKGEERSLIAKYAPPHIASNPEVELSSSRIEFEAKALELFGPGSPLCDLATQKIRPPRLLHFDPGISLLIMEDIGKLPGLDAAMDTGMPFDDIGQILGRFIGRLHAATYQTERYREQFDNHDIQQTRYELQYLPAADYAREAGAGDLDAFRSSTAALGEKLLGPGCTLIMGDLWPPSLLVQDGTLRIIDWEFAHYGRPLQDVGHFAAHCWMQAHAASTGEQERRWNELWLAFWNAYRISSGRLFAELFDKEEYQDMGIHIAAEIVMRAAGPFKEGYVYREYTLSHPLVREAVQSAVRIALGDFPESRKWFPAWN